ncbi:hypothetical protein D3C72_887670 [compost metagenome]
MKKYTITLICWCCSFFAVHSQIPNSSFEQANTDGSLSYWNPLLQCFTIGDSIEYTGPLMERYPEGKSGNYCLSLRNAYNYTQQTGIMGGAMSNTDSLPFTTFNYFFPVTDRPDSFVFYYKYKQNNQDTGLCTVSICDENMMEIGTASGTVWQIHPDYMRVSLAIDYFTNDTPRYAGITFNNSIGVPHAETHLLIDELQFITQEPTAIRTIARVPVSLYPNPVRDQLRIESPVAFRWIQITDVTGKVHMQQAFSQHISLATLPEGNYYLVLYADKIYSVQSIVKY